MFYALLSFFDCPNMTKKPVTDVSASLGILVLSFFVYLKSRKREIEAFE
jgi:hypothetical protein